MNKGIRKVSIISAMFSTLLVVNVYSQNEKIEPKFDVEESVRNVADYIVKHSSFEIINTLTGETYKSSKNLSIAKEYRIKSHFNEWRYYNGVLNIGFVALGKVLEEEKYIKYAKRNVSFLFDHTDYFRKQYDVGIFEWDYMPRFRMEMLDDCGAMGAAIMVVDNLDSQKRYKDYLEVVANYIMHDQHRLEDGTYCRKKPYEMTLWADDLYMSVPFLARYAERTGEKKYYEEAIKQVCNFDKYLWDPAKQLYYHGWYDDVQHNSLAYWGRANGWIMMAKVELLNKLPKDHPKRDEIIENLRKQIVGVARYQNISGLWHQLLDHETSFLETSCSAMFTYCIAKAVNEGWLEKRYTHIATKGWDGVASKIQADGQIAGSVMGIAIGENTYYYLSRETPLNHKHSFGSTMLAGSEILKLYKTEIHSIW
jgi:unsaturated rhamnogalacturonyl hydrolase